MYNRIALLRTERNVSRKELADAVGVNFQTIGYIERGDYKPSLELALKIAGFFGVAVEVLFSLEPFAPLGAQLTRAKELERGAGLGQSGGGNVRGS